MTIAISPEILGFSAKLDGLRFRFKRFSKAFKTALQRRKIYRQTYFELSTQSDRTLADLGIYRCDITRLALEASLEEKTHEA
jgi:uncharacterized protein YjiS (DUF1127 family)